MILDSCPVKSSNEWKELVAQVGEKNAWATWMYHNGDYPFSFLNEIDFRNKLMITSPLSGSNLLSLRDRLRIFNEEHNTSHSIIAKKIRGGDQYEISLNMSYFPINLELSRNDHVNSLGVHGSPISGNTDYIVSKYEFKNVCGRLFSTKLYENQIIELYKVISKVNNSNFENGINEVYSTKNKKRIGESEQFTIDIIKNYKSLDIDAKLERSKSRDSVNNIISKNTQRIESLISIENKDNLLSNKIINSPVFNIISNSLNDIIVTKRTKDLEFMNPEYSKLDSFSLNNNLVINIDKINLNSPLYLFAGILYLEDLKVNNINDYNSILEECNNHSISSQLKNLYNSLSNEDKSKTIFNLILKLNNIGESNDNFINNEDINNFFKEKFKEIFNTDKDLIITQSSSLNEIISQLNEKDLFENENSLFSEVNDYLKKQIISAINTDISDKEFENKLKENGLIQTVCKI